MNNDAHVLESIPAYVLGSLEEEEARLVSEHLDGCYLCRQELESYQAVAEQVLLLVPEVAPPSELKPSLLQRVQQLDQKRLSQAKPPAVPKKLFPAGALAGLVLIVLLAGFAVIFWRQAANPVLLQGPLGMRAIALQNTDAAPGASGFVIVAEDGKNGVLVVDKLPVLDDTQEYQAWLRKDAAEISGAVFPVDEDGYRGMRLVSPESLLNYSSLFVTIEPAGGSATPTGPQVLQGSLFNP